jgi:hypothetical protein
MQKQTIGNIVKRMKLYFWWKNRKIYALEILKDQQNNTPIHSEKFQQRQLSKRNINPRDLNISYSHDIWGNNPGNVKHFLDIKLQLRESIRRKQIQEEKKLIVHAVFFLPRTGSSCLPGAARHAAPHAAFRDGSILMCFTWSIVSISADIFEIKSHSCT